ncbi:PQQ-binding-like beta-propeller repeat protein [Actinomycetospora sp. CA-084318]|uniref:outer membrane protein assembly factor BamB family protein n=1 Tax=Actinomycetospora sp. CA-084318 TaxID=3239892 RepID=UPI003D99673F
MSRVLLVLGLLGALVGTAAVVADREEPDLPSTLAVVTVAVLGVAVALTWKRGRGRPAATVVAVGVLGAGATGAAAVASGWPGPGPVVLVAGAVVVLVAPTLRWLRARAGVVVGTVLLLASAGAAALVAPVVGTWPVSVPELPAPEVGPDVRWRLAAGEVRDALVAGPGLVLATAPDGRSSATALVGVDTATGHAAWAYARTGTSADRIVAAPDGRTVAVLARFRDGGRPDEARVLTVLDAASGRERWSTLVAGTTLRVVGGVVAVLAPDGHLEAWALDSGTPVWRSGPVPRCAFAPVGAAGTVGVLPVVQDCPGPLGGPQRLRAVVGLAEGTGRPVWSTPPRPLPDDRVGDVAALPVSGGGRFVASDDGAVVLDVRDGRPVAVVGPDEVLREDGVGIVVVRTGSAAGGAAPVAVVEPAGGSLVATPPCPVPGSASPALVGGVPVVLCASAEGSWELRGADARPLRSAPGTTGDAVLVDTPGGPVAVPDSLRAGPVVGM